MDQTSAVSALRRRLESTLNPAPAAERRELQSAVGPLRFGALHEWLGVVAGIGREGWSPPICLLASLADELIRESADARVVWIGRECWPYPLLLDRQRHVLAASVFIDPPDDAGRLWCIDVASRCEHQTLVIADGCGLTLAHTRRLQLAAGAGRGMCVLARPGWEERELSAAATRWVVSRERSETHRPRWAIAQVRNKDRPVFREDAVRVQVEWDDAKGAVRVPALVADRAVRQTAQAS